MPDKKNRIGRPRDISGDNFRVSKINGDIKFWAKYNKRWYSTPLSEGFDIRNKNRAHKHSIITYNDGNGEVIPTITAHPSGKLYIRDNQSDSKVELKNDSGKLAVDGDINLSSGSVFKVNDVAIGTGSGDMVSTLFDAHSILYSISDNTPAQLTVGSSTIVGRKALGNIVAMSKSESLAILNVTDGADVTGSNTCNLPLTAGTQTISGTKTFINNIIAGNGAPGAITTSGDHGLTMKTGSTDTSQINIVTNTDGNIKLLTHGDGKVAVGNGTQTGKVTTRGDTDLILDTGNSTTGSITITDGAAGEIAITPNGAGDISLGTKVTVSSSGLIAGASMGFVHVAEGVIGSTGDKTVSFLTGNKRRLRFSAINVTINNLNLVFPEDVSGNFQFIIKNGAVLSGGYTGCAITNWKVHVGDDGTNAAVEDVIWHGGSSKLPTISTTANYVDMISFYWDADEEIAYGMSAIGFFA